MHINTEMDDPGSKRTINEKDQKLFTTWLKPLETNVSIRVRVEFG